MALLSLRRIVNPGKPNRHSPTSILLRGGIRQTARKSKIQDLTLLAPLGSLALAHVFQLFLGGGAGGGGGLYPGGGPGGRPPLSI
jgi:hypothetical protein